MLRAYQMRADKLVLVCQDRNGQGTRQTRKKRPKRPHSAVAPPGDPRDWFDITEGGRTSHGPTVAPVVESAACTVEELHALLRCEGPLTTHALVQKLDGRLHDKHGRQVTGDAPSLYMAPPGRAAD